MIRLLFALVPLLSNCTKNETLEESAQESLPTLSIGDGSRTNAHRALKAASELSIVSDAWLEFSGTEGQTRRIRLVSLDTVRREPMFGRVDYPLIQFVNNRPVIENEITELDEVKQYLQRCGMGAAQVQSEARVVLASDDRTSGPRLVEWLRVLDDSGINHVLATGADTGFLTREQIEDPENAPPLR